MIIKFVNRPDSSAVMVKLLAHMRDEEHFIFLEHGRKYNDGRLGSILSRDEDAVIVTDDPYLLTYANISKKNVYVMNSSSDSFVNVSEILDDDGRDYDLSLEYARGALD